MDKKINKADLINSLKIAQFLFKDKSLVQNSFIKLFSKNGFLFIVADIHYHSLFIPISEYVNEDGDIDFVTDVNSLSNSIKFMKDVILIKESQDHNFLHIADGNIHLKLNRFNISENKNPDTIVNSMQDILGQEVSQTFEKKKLIDCISFLKNTVTKDVFDVHSNNDFQVNFNGLCAYIADRRYITRFDYETSESFVLTSLQANLILNILKSLDNEVSEIKMVKNGRNIHFILGDIIFTIQNYSTDLMDISNIVQTFNQTDVFRTGIDTLISNLNTVKSVSNDKTMLEVEMKINRNKGRLSYINDDVKYVGKFIAENGVDSEFIVSVPEIVNVLNGVKAVDREKDKVMIMMDNENECILVDFGFGDSFIAVDFIY